METMLDTVGSLPVDLQLEISDLRRQWAAALQSAASGDASKDRELRRLHRRLGALLAREARKPADSRGVRMVALALRVNAAFPELRSFEERERRRWEQKAAYRAIAQCRRPA